MRTTSVMPRLVLALDAPITAFVASDGIGPEDLSDVLRPGTLVVHIRDAERRPGGRLDFVFTEPRGAAEEEVVIVDAAEEAATGRFLNFGGCG